MRLASRISALLSGTRRLLASSLVCSFVTLSLPRCCCSLALSVAGVTATRFPSPPDLVQRQTLFTLHPLSSSSFARSCRLQAAPIRAEPNSDSEGDQLQKGPGGGGGGRRMTGEAEGVDITAEEVSPVHFSHLVDASTIVYDFLWSLLLSSCFSRQLCDETKHGVVAARRARRPWRTGRI